MTKIDVKKLDPKTHEELAATLPVSQDQELGRFMASATKAAVELSKVITPEIERLQLDASQVMVALLLYTANISREYGATLADFLASAEQAFSDVEELNASGVADVLTKAKAMVARGWCQGEMAMKWVKDTTRKEGKRLVNCHVKDQYASRWSVLGAIDAAADASSNREKARELVVKAIQTGWEDQVKEGNLAITIINDWNDYGHVPPLPEPIKLNEDAPEEVREVMRKQRAELEAQWPKPVDDPRTKDHVLAVFDRAIELAAE